MTPFSIYTNIYENHNASLFIVNEFGLVECSSDSGKEIGGLYRKHSALIWIIFICSEIGGTMFNRHVGTNTLPSSLDAPSPLCFMQIRRGRTSETI